MKGIQMVHKFTLFKKKIMTGGVFYLMTIQPGGPQTPDWYRALDPLLQHCTKVNLQYLGFIYQSECFILKNGWILCYNEQ